MLNPSHPGPIVRDLWMEERNEADIARRLGVKREALSEFLAGRAGLTPELALDLERIGWSNAEFWMRLQAAHDLSRELGRSGVAA